MTTLAKEKYPNICVWKCVDESLRSSTIPKEEEKKDSEGMRIDLK